MAFKPVVGEILTIEKDSYQVLPHPAVPSIPYGQEGRMAVVYKLGADSTYLALKAFKQSFRTEQIVGLSEKLQHFAIIPGLEVCRRVVIEPGKYKQLIRKEPDLVYAVIMPWMDGDTWEDIVHEKTEISREQSRMLAQEMCRVLLALEAEGVAHCDLSGPNVLVHELSTRPRIHLVDVEQLFGPGLDQPDLLLVGTQGYAYHETTPEMWSSTADRFAGAVLLAEMLCWSFGEIRSAAWGQSYFDPQEVQKDSERLALMQTTLAENWGQPTADLFRRAWKSERLIDCPAFKDWRQALFGGSDTVTLHTEVTGTVDPLFSELRKLEAQATNFALAGDLTNAIQEYERALEIAQSNSLGTETYIAKINSLSMHQVVRYLNNNEVADNRGALVQLSPYLPGKTSGRRLGGLTRWQFIVVLLALPAAAAVLMFELSSGLRYSAIWTTISLSAAVGAFLYGAFRRRWLSSLLFIPAIFLGGLAALTEETLLGPRDILLLAALGGVTLELFVQVGTRMIKDPVARWYLDGVVATVAGFVTGAVIDGGISGLERIFRTDYILLNFLLAAAGWLVGRIIFSLIINLRERTR